MKLRRIAAWCFLGALALLVLALAWLWTADLGIFKPQVERFLSEKIGREFRIEGNFSVDLARDTTIIAERVRVANAAWADAEDMVTIGRAEIRIDSWSLLSGPIVIESLDLDDPVIRLVNPGDADPNWVLPIEADAGAQSGGSRSGSTLLFRRIDINRASLRLESVYRDRPLNLEVERISQVTRDDNVLDLEMRATLDGNRIEIDGAVGTWDQWLAGRDIEFDVDARLGTLELSGRGRIDDVANPRRPEIHFTARAPDIDDLTRMLGLGEEGEGDIELAASMAPEPQGPLAFSIDGNIGRAEVDARGVVADLQTLDGIELWARSSGPDLGRILRLAGMPATVTGPFSATFTIEGGEEGVHTLQMNLDTALAELNAHGRLGDPETLIGSRLEFVLAGDSLAPVARAYRLPELPDEPFEVAGAIDYTDAGMRTRGPLTARLDGLAAEVDGLIALTPGIRGSDLRFAVHGPSLAALVGEFADAAPVPGLPFDARGRLQVDRDGLRFQEVTGSLGSSTVRASGLLVVAPAIAGSRFDFEMGGPAFEEVIEPLGDLRVRPGAYELSGDIAFDVDRIDLSDVRLARAGDIVRLDLQLGLPISKQRSSFALRARGRDVRRVVYGIEGFQLHEQPVSVEAHGSFRGRLLTLDRLDMELGKAKLDAQGVLDLTGAKRSGGFNLALNVPNLAALGTLAGRGLRAQALSMKLHAVGGSDALVVDRLALRIGDSVVRGTAALHDGEVPRLEVALSSDSLVLVPLLEESEATSGAEPALQDGRLIPDVALPFDALNELDASIELEIGELQRGRVRLRDLVLEADLVGGVLDIPVVGFTSRSGAVLGKARLDPADGGGAASLQLVARDFALEMGEGNPNAAMTSNIELSLHGTGRDLRTLAGSLDGVVFLDIRDARITNNRLLEMLYGSLLEEILNTVNPFRKEDPYTRIQCAILSARIEDGRWSSAPASFVSTEKIRIVINSSIDLKTEELRVGIRTTPRRALSISAAELVNPYIQVVGSLARPRLAVDKKGVLITGGVAVGTGGLSLLAQGLYDRLSNTGEPCTKAADAAIAQLGDRFPDLAIEDAERLE